MNPSRTLVHAHCTAAARAAPRAVVAAEFPREWFWHNNDEQWAKHQELIGKPMPALTLSDWRNGEVDLTKLAGKVVVVDFWATWCGPCIKSIPHTNELAAKYAEHGLVILGVCHPRDGDKMASTVTAQGIQYPVALDGDGATIAAYAVDGFPDYYLVDRAGHLVIADCRNDSVEAAIRLLLGLGADADAPKPKDAPPKGTPGAGDA